MIPRIYRALLWFDMAAADPALLQEAPAPFAAACLPRRAVDRLELNGARRRFADLAA